VTDVFAFIRSEKANFPVTWMCHKLGVARASFYRWLRPEKLTPTQQRHATLTEHVRRVYVKENGKAGRDQIAFMLRNEGTRAAVGTVGSIMRELGLRAVRMKAWKQTTDQDRDARTAHIRNHMLDVHGVRDFASSTPGTRLVGDITYLRTGSGWLYLATVIDLCTREVIGWAMASHMRTELIITAMVMARDHGRLANAGVVFHSDRGSQGGFNWSSQHFVIMEVFDGSSSASRRPGGETEVEVAWSSEVSAAGRGCVLGSDREGAIAHRSVRDRGRVAARRSAVVP